MRVAHICQTYPPMISGQSLFTKQLATGLADLGHSNLVFAASDNGLTYQSMEKGVRVDRTRSFQNPLRVGQHFFAWPHKSLLEELDKFKPDILHVHDPTIPAMLSLKAKRELNIPALLTIHQLPWFISAHFPNVFSFDEQIETQLWRYGSWILKQFDGTVAPTKTVADIISKKVGISVEVISNGIDLKAFLRQKNELQYRDYLLKKYGLDPSLPIILHVGQINPEKRVDVVAKAALKVIEDEAAQLLIVGDGKKLEAIKGLCKVSGLMDDCHFTGYVKSRTELSALYRLSTVFVTASTIETQGLVVLEAAASGLPIVAVEATCIPELVHNNENGILLSDNDVNTMADSIAIILNSDPLAKRMGNAGRRIALDHDVQLTVRKYEAMYKEMLNKYSNAQPELMWSN